MTLSKRNSRPIVVDGIQYRWTFSAPYINEDKAHKLNLTIQRASGTGTKIVGSGTCPTNNEYLLESTIIMTPSTVAAIIEKALDDGWEIDGTENWPIENLQSFVPENWKNSAY